MDNVPKLYMPFDARFSPLIWCFRSAMWRGLSLFPGQLCTHIGQSGSNVQLEGSILQEKLFEHSKWINNGGRQAAGACFISKISITPKHQEEVVMSIHITQHTGKWRTGNALPELLRWIKSTHCPWWYWQQWSLCLQFSTHLFMFMHRCSYSWLAFHLWRENLPGG